MPFHDDLEMVHQAFDAAIDLLFFRQYEARIVDPDRPHGQLRQCLIDDAHALLDLAQATEKAIVIVALTPDRNFEIHPIIDKIGKGLAHVVIDPGGAQNRARETVAQRGLARNHADIGHTIDKNPVARQQVIAVVENRRIVVKVCLTRSPNSAANHA